MSYVNVRWLTAFHAEEEKTVTANLQQRRHKIQSTAKSVRMESQEPRDDTIFSRRAVNQAESVQDALGEELLAASNAFCIPNCLDMFGRRSYNAYCRRIDKNRREAHQFREGVS